MLLFAEEEDDPTSFINHDADEEIDNLLEGEEFDEMNRNISEEAMDKPV